MNGFLRDAALERAGGFLGHASGVPFGGKIGSAAGRTLAKMLENQ